MMDYLDFPMKFPWIGGCSPFSDRPKIQASCITGILQEIMGCSCGFSHGSRDIKRSANFKWRAFHIYGKLIVVTLQEDIKTKQIWPSEKCDWMCAIIGEHAVKW